MKKYNGSLTTWKMILALSIAVAVLDIASKSIMEGSNDLLSFLFFILSGFMGMYLHKEKSIPLSALPVVIGSVASMMTDPVLYFQFGLDSFAMILALGTVYGLSALGAFIMRKWEQSNHDVNDENKQATTRKPWKKVEDVPFEKGEKNVKKLEVTTTYEFEVDDDKYDEAVTELKNNDMSLSDLTEDETIEFWNDVSINESTQEHIISDNNQRS